MTLDIALAIGINICAAALLYWSFHVSTTNPEFRKHRGWFAILAIIMMLLTIWSTERTILTQTHAAEAEEKLGNAANNIVRGLAQGNAVTNKIQKDVSRILESQKNLSSAATANPTSQQQRGIERKAIELKHRAIDLDRAQTLNQLRNLYILSHDGISSEMMAGLELPSVDWLNQQLDKYGKNWRVRSTRGPTAQTYDVKVN